MSDGRFDTLKTDLLKFGFSERLSRTVMNEAGIETAMDLMTDSMIINIQKYFAGNTVHKIVEDSVQYPATWFESFKERWCPSFLKRRFPVKYIMKPVVTKFVHVCPHIDTSEINPHIQFLIPSEGLKK